MTSAACGSCGAPTGDGAALCGNCTAELGRALLLAASIAPDLDDAVAKLLRRGTGGGSTSPEPPLPFDVAASAVSARFAAVLRYWVREMHGQAAGAQHMANWLRERTGSVRQHPEAARMLREVKQVNAAAEAVMDLKAPNLYAGPCPVCRADLIGEPGATAVQCACGAVSEVSERRDAMKNVVRDMLGSAQWCATASTALGSPVSDSAVRMWAIRKQLVPRGHRPSIHGGEDVALYRVADVMDLAEKSPRRTKIESE